ncbi:hypothetical protein L6452_33679 [Arctium lappa]|uniref:Uncharacterized protein n=1 Tax=Arctium lappa TaxID=4217 RepID=A0ACB8YG43_ARCLA|nr:hypothetical protein L6452_33679 [Arctium lappa]
MVSDSFKALNNSPSSSTSPSISIFSSIFLLQLSTFQAIGKYMITDLVVLVSFNFKAQDWYEYECVEAETDFYITTTYECIDIRHSSTTTYHTLNRVSALSQPQVNLTTSNLDQIYLIRD